MKTFLKTIYLLYFRVIYIFYSIFVRQSDNTILFIQDFPHTLDYIRNRHASTLYNRIEIHKGEKLGSKIKKILKAKYIYIDNYNVLLGYIPKKDKKIIQVWHGSMAIKTIGFSDAKVQAQNARDHIRYKRVYNSVDIYIAASEHMKEVFMNSFLVPEEKIKVLGYPKMDYYLDSKFAKDVEEVKVHREYLIDNLNIIYVPTFRENMEDNLKQIEFINQLYDDFGSKYNILYKLHDAVKVNNVEIKGKEILAEELERMIDVADIMITDYSSLVLEGLLTKKPIIYYLYDYDKYKEERGLNVDVYDLPGAKASTYEEVRDILRSRSVKINGLSQLEPKYVPANLKNGREMVTAKIIKMVLNL